MSETNERIPHISDTFSFLCRLSFLFAGQNGGRLVFGNQLVGHQIGFPFSIGFFKVGAYMQN